MKILLPCISLLNFFGCAAKRESGSIGVRKTRNTNNNIPLLFGLRGGSTSDEDDNDNNDRFPVMAARDPFVDAAPLVLATTCLDGSVALVALHTQGNVDDDDEEALMYGRAKTAPLNNSTNQYYDLPLDFGGPYRILSLGSFGLAMISTGWRADCETVYQIAQLLVQQEQSLLGRVNGIDGRILATQLSLQLAARTASEGRRPLLSCVSMVVSSSTTTTTTTTGTSSGTGIWLTDATGAYPVRALALGHNATRIQEILANQPTPQTGMDGLQSLLSLLTPTAARVVVELAILPPRGGGKLQRKRLEQLFSSSLCISK